MAEAATGRKALDIATGKRQPELKPKNVMVTMILFREKENEKSEKLREKTSTDTPAQVDFPKGTSIEDAREEQELFR